jgi:hypothetical protein
VSWAAGLKKTYHAWSIPRSVVVMAGMSPEFQLA